MPVSKKAGESHVFQEKMQADGHSIRQVFDIEKQDLAIFHAKTVIDC